MRTLSGKFYLGLTAKAAFFILFAIILPLATVSLLAFRSLSSASIAAAEASLEDASRLVRQDLLNGVRGKGEIYDLTLKTILAELEDVKDQVVTSGFEEGRLTRLYYRHPTIASAFHIDAGTGVLTIVTGSTIPKETDGFALLRKLSLSGTGTGTLGSWHMLNESSLKGAKTLTYVIPVIVDGTFRGALGIDLDSESLFSRIAHIDPAQASYVFIVHRDGRFVSSSAAITDDFVVEDATDGSGQRLMSQEVSSVLPLSSAREGATIFTRGGGGRKVLSYATIGTVGGRLFVVSPFDELVDIPRENAEKIRQSMTDAAVRGMEVLVALAALTLLGAFYFLRKSVISPVAQLKSGMQRFQQKDFSSKIDITSKDEIGDLATGFNDMADKLRQFYDDLERKVRERTEAIEKNAIELERMNKLMIGRELRMIELKKEIAALKDHPEGS